MTVIIKLIVAHIFVFDSRQWQCLSRFKFFAKLAWKFYCFKKLIFEKKSADEERSVICGCGLSLRTRIADTNF